MNRKVMASLIVIVGLVFLSGIVYFIFFYNFGSVDSLPAQKQTSAVVNQPSGQLPIINQPTAVDNNTNIATIPSANQVEFKQADLKRFSAAFAERLGSFSSHSDYGNVADLKIFMTSEMQIWADEYLLEQKSKKIDPSLYYGITTKAISQEIKKLDEINGQAEVLIKTQRRESFGATSNTDVFYQGIVLELMKEGKAWKVNKAYWQDK